MAAYCRKEGLPVHHGDLSGLQNKEGQIGAFALNTVFEHLVAHDAWLSHAHRLLAPRGLFITLQPTASFADFMGTPRALRKYARTIARVASNFLSALAHGFFFLRRYEATDGKAWL